MTWSFSALIAMKSILTVSFKSTGNHVCVRKIVLSANRILKNSISIMSTIAQMQRYCVLSVNLSSRDKISKRKTTIALNLWKHKRKLKLKRIKNLKKRTHSLDNRFKRWKERREDAVAIMNKEESISSVISRIDSVPGDRIG